MAVEVALDALPCVELGLCQREAADAPPPYNPTGRERLGQLKGFGHALRSLQFPKTRQPLLKAKVPGSGDRRTGGNG